MPDDVMGVYQQWSEAHPAEEPPLDPAPPHEGDPAPEIAGEGIVPLGHDRGVFYYLSRSAGQVFALTAQAHTKNALTAMASVSHFWQRGRFKGDNGIQWDRAIDWLMNGCRQVGIYDPRRLRGRGAWWDDGRPVLHVGNRLLVNHEPVGLDQIRSHFIYESARSLDHIDAKPLATGQAHALTKLCQRFAWERPVSGVLLSGWIFVARVCGGLAWRPHVWLTGASGSGKTTLLERVILPCLGSMALHVQGKTSEPGIRQALASDALPVIYDEAEGEDDQAAERLQGVLDFARVASSESGAEIVKGSQRQTGPVRYRPRTCMLFASINISLKHHADENRTTVLALRKPIMTQSEFAQLVQDIAGTLTPEFAAGLLARSVAMLPVIRETAHVFAKAIARHLGSQRAGDQLGALMAGAWCLARDRVATDVEADAFVARHQWSEAVAAQEQTDEAKLLSTLMHRRARVTPGNSAPIETTLGLLIEASRRAGGVLVPEHAETVLKQHGIKYQTYPPGFFVANNHPVLAEHLKGTPWAAGWHAALRRLPGAETPEKVVRFGPGAVSRTTFIPADLLGEDDHGPPK